MQNRRKFIKKAGMGTVFMLLAQSMLECSKHVQPNIIWIIADDLSPDLGCYGHPLVQTPHIDRIAREGVRFTHAYATGVGCSPSRSALNTGMYQTTLGAHHHRTLDKKPLPDHVQLISQYFSQAGYFTCNGYGTPDSRPGKRDLNFIPKEPIFDGSDWSQRQEGQPFFAQVQIYDPHRPFERDPENQIDHSNVDLPPYYPDHPVAKRDWANYLEAIQVLDRKVGEVLTRLDNENLTDNTVVFFFSDQGRPHLRGKCLLYEGGIQVPLIIRWPGHLQTNTVNNDLVSLIDLGPTCLKLAGIDIPNHMHGIDFLSSSIAKREFIVAARDLSTRNLDRIRCIRTKRFKYIRNFMPEKAYLPFNHYHAYRYPVRTLLKVLEKKDALPPEQARLLQPTKPKEELYDLKTDPFELHNLARKDEYQDKLYEMQSILDAWIVRTDDQAEKGGFGATSMEELIAMRDQKYKPLWEKRGFNPDDMDHNAYLYWWKKKLGIDGEKMSDDI